MPSEYRKTGELERTLGLPAALAIGVGTMVGAGIFVFPGIAAGDAGPAAMLSFALAGLIALLVALSTAELATAMPESGGGYYFVSRTFGPLPGMLVGIGQWAGLVFASSFYLVGFGQYVVKLLAESGCAPGDPGVLIALGSALALTGVNLVGTRRAGSLQNGIVVFLAGILTLLFLYGVLNAAGVTGDTHWPLPFAPKGITPIFTTTALIFTSFLGFVQIATVAGEVKAPHRNLPRALAGSVLIVTVLYVLALFVSTSVLTADRLAELGETAMVEVGRQLVGPAGALAILGAGLLATLSSANASILSSSRAVYALGRDGMLPRAISRVNQRFSTPHVALLVVGVPIAGLTLLGRIEVLAEVASLLHLVIYGLICLAQLVLRRRRPVWYAPTFYAPGSPFLPALGAAASFGLIGLMGSLSIAVGLGILLLALVWYGLYARGRELEAPRPPHILPAMREPRIVVPVEVPDASALPVELLGAFRRLELFLLGYKVVPEQTSPQQAQEESEGEEQEALEDVRESISGKGINVTSNLIYTPDLTDTLDRHIRDKNCQAVLFPHPIESLKRLLVPIYHLDQVNVRLATILRDLAGSSRLPVTLLLMESEEEEAEEAVGPESLQHLASNQLEQAGLSRDQIRPTKAEVTDLAGAVAQIAGEEDLIVLGEAGTEERTRLFNRLHDEVLGSVSCPIMVVLGEKREEEEEQ